MIIDAVLTPAEIALLPQADLSDTTCVVFDVLRATSSMVTGLAHGVAGIIPVRTIEEARSAIGRFPEAILAGERHGDPIEGFHIGNSPFEYRDLEGRTVISTTTNGTIALRACEGAPRVLVGAILNLGAVADEVRRAAPTRLLLVCAGTFATFALEDAWAAGRLAGLLGGEELTDAARAVMAIARGEPDPLAALRSARNGVALASKGRGAEVEWCARESVFPVNGVLEGGAIRRLGP
jgi:2-phosphosulfolactate phosphatase